MEKPKNIEDAFGNQLPNAWTDLANGVTRLQVKNILQFPRVAVYLDGKPVAVLLSLEEYRKLTAHE